MVPLMSSSSKELKYYPWRDTFTYDADITMVIGMRDVGKTFGLREQFLRDFINNSERFVAVSRNKGRIPKLANGFFDSVVAKTQDPRLRAWADDYKPIFNMKLSRMTMGHKTKKGKICDVQDIGYFVPLSRKQDAKEETFVNTRRFVLDEAIIEPDERQFSHYQLDEWGKLASIVDSCSRERPDDERHKPNIYLLANACDLINPWFQKLGISEIPEYGKHWYRDKTFLLDYVDASRYSGEYADSKMNGTVSGRMLRDQKDGRMAAANEFKVSTEFVAERPRSAHYDSGYIYRGKVYGLWIDYKSGLGYVCGKWVRGAGPMYALTTEDNRINYFTAKEATKALRMVIDLYGVGLLRFENVGVQAQFLQIFRDFGLR